MRCHICNAEDDTISFDRRDGTFSPCRTCQAVIHDTIAGYDQDELEEEIYESFD